MSTAPRRHLRFWALTAVGVALLMILTALLVVSLTRQTPSGAGASAAATPTPAFEPTPSPSPSPDSATAAQQHKEYRAYVSTVVRGSVAVIASLGGLVGCRDGSRSECAGHIHDAKDQVSSLQSDLDANPAPPCLASADAMLQDALTFQQKGLDTAQTAVEDQNRVRLVQGVLLTAVGLWRGGEAIVTGRQADC
ncbi:MAG TPA: hypothetical protein VIC57_05635 [Candidatus Dormibacteraeota bacterium]